MRQAGRYLPEYKRVRAQAKNFLDLCYSPDMAAEVTLQPIDRYDFDAAILFADILLIPDALGQKVEFVEGTGPVLEALSSQAEIDRLSQSRLHDHLSPVYETVRTVRKALHPDKALIGFAGAPWTVACYMIAGRPGQVADDTRIWAYKNINAFDQLIDVLVESTISYLSAQVEAGANALQIFDTWAGALPESACERWSVRPIQQIAKALKERHPEIPLIAFPRGVGATYEIFARLDDIDALGLDPVVPLGWAREKLSPHVCLQGNLDPLVLVAGGKILEEAISHILESFTDIPAVFNLGHGIVPQTPPEHVAALVEQVRATKS